MNKSSTRHSFLEAGRRLTRLQIDGSEVNPAEVTVDSIDEVDATSTFEMEVSVEVLVFELRQAEVNIDIGGLAEFVCADLRDQPTQALLGYLGIVRGILQDDSSRGRWRLFGSRRPAIPLKWSLVSVKRVTADREQLKLFGTAMRRK